MIRKRKKKGKKRKKCISIGQAWYHKADSEILGEGRGGWLLLHVVHGSRCGMFVHKYQLHILPPSLRQLRGIDTRCVSQRLIIYYDAAMQLQRRFEKKKAK